MAQARIVAAGLDGIEAYKVELEVDQAGGLPHMQVVGLPDAALRESKVRVKAAVRASGYEFPANKVVIVNLVPARRRKEEGAAFDLPIALGVLASNDPPVVNPRRLRGTAALGELTLSGSVRPFRGALAAAQTLAESGVRRLLVARHSARSAALGAGGQMEVIPVDTLCEAVRIVAGKLKREPLTIDADALLAQAQAQSDVDLVDVRGAENAKRALVVAAAGGHDLLMIGPPGAGKTMLARRMPGLLPPPSLEEVLEVTRLHGSTRAEDPENPADVLVTRRPFRAPHHTASYAALVGGCSNPRPGEISLAHRGVLFLDELPEFSKASLEALREPLESRTVTIARARHTKTFPADFLLVAAMNPCPCGFVGDSRRACRCTPHAVERYTARISGPLMDRLDLSIRLTSPAFEVLQAPAKPHSGPLGTAAQRERVAAARAIQLERAGVLNARLDVRQLHATVNLTPEAKRALAAAAKRRMSTARGLSKIQKVARTVADLEGRDRVTPDDLALALHMRLSDALASR